jgi:hypothetical protein
MELLTEVPITVTYMNDLVNSYFMKILFYTGEHGIRAPWSQYADLANLL